MEPESDELEYRLTGKLSYSAGGDMHPAEFVLLNPPTSRQSKYAGALRQGFMQALREQMNNDKIMAAAEAAREAANAEDQDPQDPGGEEEEDNPAAGHQVINMVAMAEKVDYPAYLDCGKKLLASGVMLWGGVHQAKESPIEKMSLWDLEEILGRYIQRFINTSRS